MIPSCVWAHSACTWDLFQGEETYVLKNTQTFHLYQPRANARARVRDEWRRLRRKQIRDHLNQADQAERTEIAPRRNRLHRPGRSSGPAGPAGSTGPAGENGTNGTGTEGHEGKQGVQGIPGEKGTTGYVKALPSKAPETGTWSVSYPMESKGQVATSISFVIPLAHALGATDVHFVNEGGTKESAFNETTFAFEAAATSDCPGTIAEPAAAPGNLCVYQQELAEGVKEVESGLVEAFIRPATTVIGGSVQGASTSGAFLQLFQRSEEEASFAHGTWAVTAP